MTGINKFVISLILMAGWSVISAQDNEMDKLMNEKVINGNTVYKPVVSLGAGVLNFHGDVRNNYTNPVIGNFGYKLNISTFLDLNRYYKANFFLIYGKLSANQRSLTELEKNLNFKTDLVVFGINLEYTFNHIFKNPYIRPFLALGIESIQYTPKGDLLSAPKIPYHYWSDGTIRSLSETAGDLSENLILRRDYVFETDLRNRERTLYGLGSYSRSSFSFPVDAGLDLKISERVTVRLGTSLHFTSTDYIDNVSSKGTHIKGKTGKDMFSFSYFNIRLDLFSQSKSKLLEKLFTEMEVDDVMLSDEDGDLIADPADECPATPSGIMTDSSGCPFDNDGDGVYDYLDKEENTLKDAWVDMDGKTVTEDEFLASLMKRSEAMERQYVENYYNTIGSGSIVKVSDQIPEKFKKVDSNSDAYISFEELLNAIDDYFDNTLDFKVEDIYKLNNFFFEQ